MSTNQIDDITEIIQLLNVSSDKKQELSEKLKANGVNADIMAEIREQVKTMDDGLRSKFPNESSSVSKVLSDLKAEEAAAAEDLDKELTVIDSEVNDLGKQTSKELDDQDIEEVRKKL